jgi:hypothetical protein
MPVVESTGRRLLVFPFFFFPARIMESRGIDWVDHLDGYWTYLVHDDE